MSEDDTVFQLIILTIGSFIGSLCTYCVMHDYARQSIQIRAIESGDAQYHPTTGKFMFNGELKAEENE